MSASHVVRLHQWIEEHRLDSGHERRWLLEAPQQREARVATVRFLNELESRFDETIHTTTDDYPLDWDAIRHELALFPQEHPAWAALVAPLRDTFAAQHYAVAHIRRAERLWGDFLLIEEEQVSALQVPAGWLAALDYLLQSLYFTDKATQEEIGRRHSVSTSTVGLRFRALVDGLDVRLFDHPARKRLLAQRAIAIDGGQMSEAEFNHRLLRGDLALPTP